MIAVGPARKRKPRTVHWHAGGVWYTCDVLSTRCPMCGETAVMALPPPELAKQTDGTTHVCFSGIGGCNHGFEVT